MNDWKLPWEGGCRCGHTRVQVSAPPMLTSACHCTGCQRMPASAFSLTIAIPTDGFSIVAGEPVIGGVRGAARHYFCSQCMSWMFTRMEGMDNFVNLRASVLDDRSWFVPFIEFWTQEKLPWVSTPAAHSFQTQPQMEEFGALIQEFAQHGTRPS